MEGRVEGGGVAVWEKREGDIGVGVCRAKTFEENSGRDGGEDKDGSEGEGVDDNRGEEVPQCVDENDSDDSAVATDDDNDNDDDSDGDDDDAAATAAADDDDDDDAAAAVGADAAVGDAVEVTTADVTDATVGKDIDDAAVTADDDDEEGKDDGTFWRGEEDGSFVGNTVILSCFLVFRGTPLIVRRAGERSSGRK